MKSEGVKIGDKTEMYINEWTGPGCGWESLKNVTLGNVTMSHRTREAPPNALRLSHSTMIGLPRAQH
ncbi:hypothetical protein EVAR_89889_1 [Eumeta japonica]|uniref:Uncharacterized protein n=1 Tax=Eumeta variegata TaxID=151549 RepID=A0A4C1YX26_EUMVA|nr:hypothetical protein EVAR_89889_1 [Eumeta japonica]